MYIGEGYYYVTMYSSPSSNNFSMFYIYRSLFCDKKFFLCGSYGLYFLSLKPQKEKQISRGGCAIVISIGIGTYINGIINAKKYRM